MYIEEIKSSKIGSNVKFTSSIIDVRSISRLRRANMKITEMNWITLRPVYNTNENTIYNPKALILNFLN